MNRYVREDKQKEVLEDLHQLMIDSPQTISDLSKEIGISRNWLSRFLKGNRVGYFATLKIENYIKYARDTERM